MVETPKFQLDPPQKPLVEPSLRTLVCMTEINNTHKKGYMKVSQYCTDIECVNPHSTVILCATDDNMFDCIFISYEASLERWIIEKKHVKK